MVLGKLRVVRWCWVKVSFVLFFFPRGVLDEILNLIESVSEGFPSYFSSAGASYNLAYSRARS